MRPRRAGHEDSSAGGTEDAGEDTQQRALAGAVGADDAHGLPAAKGEADAVEGSEGFCCAAAQGERGDDQVLEPGRTVMHQTKALGQVLDADSGFQDRKRGREAWECA